MKRYPLPAILSICCFIFFTISHPNLGRTAESTQSPGNFLTVTGKIDTGGPRSFSLSELMAETPTTITVTSHWKNEKSSYTGIPLQTLLNLVNIDDDASYLEVVATNKYKALIRIEDILKYEYLLSYKKDGKLYSELKAEENRGPLAIVINFDKHPELNWEVYKHQLVWYVSHIHVK